MLTQFTDAYIRHYGEMSWYFHQDRKDVNTQANQNQLLQNFFYHLIYIFQWMFDRFSIAVMNFSSGFVWKTLVAMINAIKRRAFICGLVDNSRWLNNFAWLAGRSRNLHWCTLPMCLYRYSCMLLILPPATFFWRWSDNLLPLFTKINYGSPVRAK